MAAEEKKEVKEIKSLGKCSTGMEPKAAALLSYLLGFITGIVFFIIEKDNKFVRFHAMQSIVVFGGLFVLRIALIAVFALMPGAMYALATLISLAGFILWVLLMVKAYQGEYFKLPLVGDFAEKQVK